jgi:hypothetical protein
MSFGGGSSGGGNQQTTQVTPYAPAQPALNQILSEAGQLYGQGVGASGYVAPSQQTLSGLAQQEQLGTAANQQMAATLGGQYLNPFLSPLLQQQAGNIYTNVGSSSYDSSQNQSGREQSNDGGYVDRIQRISSGVEPGYTPTSSQPFGVSPEQAYQEGRITVDQYREAQQVQDNAALNQPNLIEKAFDLYKQYSPLGIAFNLGGSLLDTIGGASKSLQNKAMTFSLNKRLSNIYEDNPDFEDYENVSEIPGEIGSKVQDLESDLQGIRDGTFTQTDFTEKYGSGDSANFSSERDAINQLTPYAPYAISGQTPQDSMVNQYFANQPTSSLSSSLETSYNNAKSNINNILGITTPSQQFGYSAQPYGLLSSTNMADNPYKDYLTTRGLI